MGVRACVRAYARACQHLRIPRCRATQRTLLFEDRGENASRHVSGAHLEELKAALTAHARRAGLTLQVVNFGRLNFCGQVRSS